MLAVTTIFEAVLFFKEAVHQTTVRRWNPLNIEIPAGKCPAGIGKTKYGKMVISQHRTRNSSSPRLSLRSTPRCPRSICPRRQALRG